jgi:acyl-coenzyme A synthetase/AMP-(fatty) acid ligase
VLEVPKSAAGKLLRRVLKSWEKGEEKGRRRGLVVKELVQERAKL